MRGDRYTMRRGELVYLSRERRCTSRKIRMGFKKVFRDMRTGAFFRRHAVAVFVWIPESPNHPGLYASRDRSEGRNSTNTASEALSFTTKQECAAWCERNPHPVFEPKEHGFDS